MINIDEVVDEVSSLLFKTKQIPSYDKLLKIAKNYQDSMSGAWHGICVMGCLWQKSSTKSGFMD